MMKNAIRRGDVFWADLDPVKGSEHVGPRAHLLRRTMNGLERRLGAGFVRIRRSLLVNAAAITALEPYGKGTYTVLLRDGSRLLSSRYYGARVRDLVRETD